MPGTAVQGGMVHRVIGSLAAALLACGGLPEAGSLRVDASADLAGEVQEGARRIEAATGIAVHVSAGDAELRVTAYIVPAAMRQPDNAPEGTTWGGHFNGRAIVLNEELAVELRPTVMIHEMIHALILTGEHLPEPGHLMSEVGGDCLTDADLELICARVSCPRFVAECSAPR